MQQLKHCITRHVNMEEQTLEAITSRFEKRQLPKGEHFLQSGNLCRQMAFIASGYLRVYSIAGGKEVTIWIAGASRFLTSLSSFVFQTDNPWNIQSLTDSTLYVIKRSDHFELSERYPKWLEFDNLLLASSFMQLEKRMFQHLHTTAEQRFNNLLEEEPKLFNHVPLQYIASMLGITAESLSRLRKKRLSSIS